MCGPMVDFINKYKLSNQHHLVVSIMHESIDNSQQCWARTFLKITGKCFFCRTLCAATYPFTWRTKFGKISLYVRSKCEVKSPHFVYVDKPTPCSWPALSPAGSSSSLISLRKGSRFFVGGEEMGGKRRPIFGNFSCIGKELRTHTYWKLKHIEDSCSVGVRERKRECVCVCL